MTETDIETKTRVKEIKQSFRLLMNGVAAQSMREKGVDYYINWGASLPHLREMAAEYTPDHTLALELWKENVRECKILATMLMPHDTLSLDIAMLWVEQTRTQEIAEIATMNLYQHLPYATEMALMLMSKNDDMARLHGFNIMARLFARGITSDDTRDINEFLDQAIAVLAEPGRRAGSDSPLPLRHAAWNAVSRFADINDSCHAAAQSALKSIKMQDWL